MNITEKLEKWFVLTEQFKEKIVQEFGCSISKTTKEIKKENNGEDKIYYDVDFYWTYDYIKDPEKSKIFADVYLLILDHIYKIFQDDLICSDINEHISEHNYYMLFFTISHYPEIYYKVLKETRENENDTKK